MTTDDDDLFEPAGPPPRKTGRDAFGPIFVAQYDNTLCSGCGDYVEPGEDLRADGTGGWVHADDECEALFLGQSPRPTTWLPPVCQLPACGCSGKAHP